MPEHKIGDEIERVFKVRHIPENIEKYPHENIVQGYLAIDVTGSEVRLRKIGDRYFETYKGAGRLQRRELEIELSPDQFNTLWLGTEGRRIEKIRYQINEETKKSSSTYFGEIWKVWCLPKSSFLHGRKAKNSSLRIGSATK
jgi:CYTH domain-containing protein